MSLQQPESDAVRTGALMFGVLISTGAIAVSSCNCLVSKDVVTYAYIRNRFQVYVIIVQAAEIRRVADDLTRLTF